MKKGALKKLLIFSGIILLGLAIFALTQWYKPHRNPCTENGVEVSADNLINEYTNNEKEANTKYLDKTLAVKSEITQITKNQEGKTVITLKTNDPIGSIMCTLKTETNAKVGDTVTVKGLCTGYLSDVILINCCL
jgi:hypothetical protein